MAGALDGVRVVEVGSLVGAAYATKLLADLGADVVKVEPPDGGDAARHRGPFPGGVPHPERSGLFLYLNANKRGVALDLRRRRAARRSTASSPAPTCWSTTSTRPRWRRTGSPGTACTRSTPAW